MASDIIIPGYETSIGSKLLVLVDHFGPANYNSVTSEVYLASSVSRGGFDRVSAGNSFSGLYVVNATIPASAIGTGSASAILKWLYNTPGIGVNGVTFTAGTGQTNGTYVISGTGGGGTGAQVTITIAGGLITTAFVSNAGRNYTSVPTFTVAAGGTPGVLTATIGAVSGGQVVTGTNLSAEAVRLEMIVY